MCAVSEGTATSPATRNLGYDVIVTGRDGGPEVFSDYGAHPFASGRAPKVINSAGLASTASGRYQILLRFWRIYASRFRYLSFSPGYQDMYFDQQCRERGCLPDVDAGRFGIAVRKLDGLWASFPGRSYDGQAQHTMDHLAAIYADAGGTIVT